MLRAFLNAAADSGDDPVWTAGNTQRILDEQTDAWGIKVTNVELKHVDLNENMVRAMARQAEAERERRSKVIHATGELEASEALVHAAEALARAPNAIQLRYLQTLAGITGEGKTTIVFPLPMDLLSGLVRKEPERG